MGFICDLLFSFVENQVPTYVNMHELASMAASKAQEMTFLPPPPPELVSGPTSNEVQDKVSCF